MLYSKSPSCMAFLSASGFWVEFGVCCQPPELGGRGGAQSSSRTVLVAGSSCLGRSKASPGLGVVTVPTLGPWISLLGGGFQGNMQPAWWAGAKWGCCPQPGADAQGR